MVAIIKESKMKITKTQKLILDFYKSIIYDKPKKQKKLWDKITKKSFNCKKTHAIK